MRGMVTTTVYDKDGNVKRREPGFLRRLFGLPGPEMISRHHNIITKEGDSLIIDGLSEYRYFEKVDNKTGYIQVGTGWNGKNPKNNKRCNEPKGNLKKLIDGPMRFYPGPPDSIVYNVIFEPGELDNININEVCLLNGNNNNASSLAYAEIKPPANVTLSDTLEIYWQIYAEGE
jgi:hypothetical protein